MKLSSKLMLFSMVAFFSFLFWFSFIKEVYEIGEHMIVESIYISLEDYMLYDRGLSKLLANVQNLIC